jgi:hypothetical protein
VRLQPHSLPKAPQSSAAQTDPPSLDADSGGEDCEHLDELLWPLLPLFGETAATFQGAVLTYGTFVAVDQTVPGHVLLYVLKYEDGDIGHLDETEATAAVALARANRRDTAPPTAPARLLRRRGADAHSAPFVNVSESRTTNSRKLERRDADAHTLEAQRQRSQ